MSEKFEIPVEMNSPVDPTRLSLDDTIKFRCHKDISCFNQCCQHIDLPLTPYDIVRLKNRLGMNSQVFLKEHTLPFAMDGHQMPGIKLKPREGSDACSFVTEEGCSVYEDRPTACRYYAMGQMAMRGINSNTDEDVYFMVREDHCKGHDEDREITVGDFRKEQGVEEYDEINRGWRQVLLKKRSSGPTIGNPSKRSMQLYFLASYDMDSFLSFIESEGFQQVYELDEATMDKLRNDEAERVKFGGQFLKQVLFGEGTIPLRADAQEKRVERRREMGLDEDGGESKASDISYDGGIAD